MTTPRSSSTSGLTDLFQRIRETESGALPFAEFMDWALYDPDWGYYRDPEIMAIGRTGDFFTSVSVGRCFGLLLACEIERRWREELGAPATFTIVEQGAHDGQLAEDILQALGSRLAESKASLRYVIIEPDANRRRRLNERFTGGVEVVAEANAIRESVGFFLCNELLDALPVHLLRLENGAWKERCVTVDDQDQLTWRNNELKPGSKLSDAAARLGTGFPEGYTTEICLVLDDWIESISSLFTRGIWWMIDYGFEEEEYYAPHRNRGTLQCYRDHRKSENPFEAPGESDITAHVDFSRLIRQATTAGLTNTLLVDQHDFLTQAALPWLTSLEAEDTAREPENRKLIRQFQTLTHPGMMGRVFKVAEFTRGL